MESTYACAHIAVRWGLQIYHANRKTLEPLIVLHLHMRAHVHPYYLTLGYIFVASSLGVSCLARY